MSSSNIIKIKDKNKSVVTRFLLKQFHCDEDENGKGGKVNAQANREKTDAEALRNRRIQAQQEAQRIMENAGIEAQRIEREAFEKGFAQGEQEGRQKAAAELAPLIECLTYVNAEFQKIKESFYTDHQDIILELALKIARKVIHQEIASNDELIIGVLTSAIKLAIDREKLKIRIHPEDLEVCLLKRQDIMKNSDGINQILFEPDESIDRGGALIEYAFGEIDARIEQQFAEVDRELRNAHLDMEEMI